MEFRDNMWHCVNCKFKAIVKKTVQLHAAEKHKKKPRAVTIYKSRDVEKSRFSFACPECEFRAARSTMVDHFCHRHGVELNIQHMKFSSWHQFEEWKARMEDAYEVTYEKTADAIRINDGKILRYTYLCFREDFIVSKPSGSRNFSKRICCPSDIRVHHDQVDGDVVVRFVETHFGHSNRIVDDIKAKHQIALDSDTVCSLEVTDSGWKVWIDGDSSTAQFVCENDSTCKCHLRCETCNVCIHTFNCTCDAFARRPTVCEHIHLLATYLRAGNNPDASAPEANSKGLKIVEQPPSNTKGELSVMDTETQEPLGEMGHEIANAVQTMDVLYSVVKRDIRSIHEAAMAVEALSELISKIEAFRTSETEDDTEIN